MADSATLLRNYAASGSEEAFGQLVARYFDLVYSVAIRLAGGDTAMAQDAAQSVFTDLARRAPLLTHYTVLGGWLYRHAFFTASKMVRAERRRQARERQAVEMNALNDKSEAAWRQLAPVLDEAMNGLGAQDRNAIVLRFFEQQSFRTVGQTLGTTEEGARKRVDRAIDKLRAGLLRRGVTISAAALAAALTSQAVTIAPACLAATVAGASLTGAAAGSGATLTLLKLMAMTKLKILAGAAVLTAGLAIPMVLEYQANLKLREENRTLNEQAAQLAELDQLRAENARLAKGQSQATNEQFLDLMRLRGQVGMLKNQLAELAKVRDENARLLQQLSSALKAPIQTETLNPAAEQQKQIGIAKLNYTKNWLMAFHKYAEKNNGQFPADFSQAAAFFPADATADGGLMTDQYEVMYRGLLARITNPPPARTIVIREKQPSPSWDGRWVRAYGFADGHSEIHTSPTADFQTWESDKLYPVQTQ